MGESFKQIADPVLDVLEFTYAPIIYPARQISRGFRSGKDRLFPDAPEFPSINFPEEQEPSPLVDEDEARRLAQQRRSIEQRRAGRSSLRIDRPVRNPGVAAGTGSGLRIP